MTEVGLSQRLLSPNVILFGPPGVGKSEVGRRLADRLDRRFVDTDELIVERAGVPIPQIFKQEGERVFRRLEREICLELAARAGLVIACGGGALLEPDSRDALEQTGTVFCLRADRRTLANRLAQEDGRPLLDSAGGRSLESLLDERLASYDSFSHQLDTTDRPPDMLAQALHEAVIHSDRWRAAVDQGSGYELHVGPDLLSSLPELLAAAGAKDRIAIVTDENVGPLYGRELADRLQAPLLVVEAGEGAKRMPALERLQNELLAAGLERESSLLVLGGGVVGDLAGLAAATYMRGIRWINLPTSLLAIVDASIGGKVGIDLAGGKNMVGAFHPPALVAADLDTLASLPPPEWRNGMAELIKAAIIGDPVLFRWLEEGYQGPTGRWLERAQAVKIEIIERDPQEQGERAKLNAGHTVGHALEVLSEYRLAHGEAVSLGLVAESVLAVRLGLAPEDWPGRVAAVLRRFGLPTQDRQVDVEGVQRAMRADKKNRGGEPRFALPLGPGAVDFDLVAPADQVEQAVRSLKAGQ